LSSNTNIGNTPVNQGYVQLIHTGETGGIDGTLRTLYDGDGTASDLQIASNAVKISTQLYIGSKTITEYVQDVVGDMLDTNGSHTNITATYDDNGDGAIDLVATGAISGLTEGTGVTITGTANKTIAIGQSVGTSDSVTFGRVNLGSTDTSSFLTGDPKISATGYMMIQGIVNETETGTLPAAIVFGNNSTYGSDEISLITNGLNRLFIASGGNITISQDLTISGDLQVNGTTTTVNQTNLDVSDNIIGLNRGAASNANDSGLIIERGSTGNNVFIGWKETNDRVLFGTTLAEADDTGDLTIADADIQANRLYGDVTGNVTGNADTATALATARNFSLTGDVTAGAVSFDGSGNVALATTIAENSVALGTDTTGNYVGTITTGSGVSTSGASTGEDIAHNLSINASQTGITSIYNSALQIGSAADEQRIDFGTSDEIRLGSSTQTSVKIKTDPLGSAQDEVIIGDGTADVDFVVDGSSGSTIFKVDAGTGNTAVTGDLSISGSFNPATITASTSVRTPLIEFTDGDDAITIANGGGMTFAKGFTVTSGASSFGANVDIKNTGGTILQLNTSSTDVDINGLLGRINFSAPDEFAGSDSNLLAASIVAKATADFTSTSNKTDMIFELGVSETASEKFRIVSDGKIKIGNSYTLPSSDGSANQILKTNGSGTVSFADESAGISFNGSTANGLLTYGSSTTADVESTLTFDASSNLNLLSDSGKLRIGAGNNLEIYHDGTDDIINTKGSAFKLLDNGTEKLRVTAGGNIQFNNAQADINTRFATTGSTNTLWIDGGTDRVGIGIVSPQRKLHVSTGNTDIAARFENTTSNGSVAEFISSGDSRTLTIQTDHIYSNGNLFFGLGNYTNTYRAGTHIFQEDTGNTEVMRITGNNVGIGVSPSYKLDVAGQARTTNGMLVDNGTTAGFFTTDSDNVNFGASTSGKGLKLFTANTEKMRIDSSGNVGINATNPVEKLCVRSTATYATSIEYDASTRLRIGVAGSGVATFTTDNNAACAFTKDVVAYATSDKRLKDNIKPLDNALDKINKINGVEFDWNDTRDEDGKPLHSYKGHDVGVIAQEIEEVLPEVVTTRDNGYKAVKYEKIVPLLIEAIKEQQKQIEELKNG